MENASWWMVNTLICMSPRLTQLMKGGGGQVIRLSDMLQTRLFHQD